MPNQPGNFSRLEVGTWVAVAFKPGWVAESAIACEIEGTDASGFWTTRSDSGLNMASGDIALYVAWDAIASAIVKDPERDLDEWIAEEAQVWIDSIYADRAAGPSE
jgi:hypothetical protein